jgi:hypothetical protein
MLTIFVLCPPGNDGLLGLRGLPGDGGMNSDGIKGARGEPGQLLTLSKPYKVFQARMESLAALESTDFPVNSSSIFASSSLETFKVIKEPRVIWEGNLLNRLTTIFPFLASDLPAFP